MNTLNKPTLLLDENRCKLNISKMAEKVKASNCEFRPHFKTHQSHKVGRWIRSQGVTGITVSSPQMALYFSEDKWKDITIAFPFYKGMVNELKQLENNSNIRLFLHSESNIDILEQELANPFKFYIEIDGGYGRSGLHYKDIESISKIIKRAEKSNKADFHGFYIHDGRTYKARGKAQIEEMISPSLSALFELKKHFPQAKLSLGDTPSASVLNNFDGLDELTPGNFVFYDWMQVQIGSCSVDEVALFAVFPVAQSIKEGNQAIIHGGAVHLSKDNIQENGHTTYGQPVKFEHNQIQVIENSFIAALSQEHGTLHGFENCMDKESIIVCPIHSCLTANLFDSYHTSSGIKIDKRVLS